MTRRLDDTTRYERLRERFRNGDLDRRHFLGLLGAAGAAYGLVTPYRALAQDVSEVRFDGWGGVVSEALRANAFDPFTQATGVTVVDGTFGGGDEYLSRVKASQPGEYNIAHLSGVFDYARYHGLGLTSELNEANIPNLEYVIPKLVDVFRKVSDGTLSCVPYDYGTTGLAYNRKHISDEEMKEKGAKILIDEAHKGKIGGWSD